MIPCVFPFLYNGFLYNGCILDPDDEKSYWCATEADENGVFCDHEWGHCNENCPRVDISMIESDLIFQVLLIKITLRFYENLNLLFCNFNA